MIALDERLLAVLDLVHGDHAERRVAVLVDLEVDPRMPSVTSVSKSADETAARSVPPFSIAASSTWAACAAYAVYGFGALPVCLGEPVDELLAGALQLIDRDARLADVHVVRRGAGALDRSPRSASSRPGRGAGRSGLPALMSLISLPPLLQTMPPRKTASAPDELDLAGQRLVARRLLVPLLVARGSGCPSFFA